MIIKSAVPEDNSQLIKEYYNKAMSLGKFVPWKDKNYLEPRYHKVLRGNPNTHKVESINTIDAFSDNGNNNYPFNVYYVSADSTSVSAEATIDDLIDKKLFIGNNGVFFLINGEQDFPIIKDVDRYAGCEGIEIGDIDESCENTPEYLTKVGEVSFDVFKEYLDRCNKPSSSSMGETSLF